MDIHSGRRHTAIRAVLVCAFLVVPLSVTGCGERKFEDPYLLEDRSMELTDILPEGGSAEEGSGYGELFASDLCVVMDEGAYDSGEITAEAGAVFDLSSRETLYSKNAFERLYPASITKVMTAILAIRYGNLSDMVTVTEDAVITEPGASLCGIRPGDRLTLEQLLYGLMLPSGNDAGAAIAVHIAGSIEAFADMMNQEARALGAVDTHFVNPHGLTDENHYTTAYDLYLIYKEALTLPEFREITGTVSYDASYVDASGAAVEKTWSGTNMYMLGKRDTPGGLTVFSSKTGTTQAAGSCLIMATRDTDGGEYISVVLKSEDRSSLYDNMTKLISKIDN